MDRQDGRTNDSHHDGEGDHDAETDLDGDRRGCGAVDERGPGARAADEKADAELKKFEGKWTTPSADGGKVTYTFKGRS